MLDFELAGSANDAARLVGGRAEEFRDALRADWAAAIPGYVLTLSLASWRFVDRRLAVAGVLLAVATGLFDYIEDFYLWQGLDTGSDRAFELAAAFAVLKFALLVPAAGFAIWALVRPATRG